MKPLITNLFMRTSCKETASEVEEELYFHIEMLELKFTQHGMSAGQAKAAALRRFGNLDRIKHECVCIRRRNSLLRRVFKTSTILIGFTGLAIHFLSADYKVAHIGDTLMMIAISGRLFLYVRGLVPATFLPRIKERSLISEIPEKPECS